MPLFTEPTSVTWRVRDVANVTASSEFVVASRRIASLSERGRPHKSRPSYHSKSNTTTCTFTVSSRCFLLREARAWNEAWAALASVALATISASRTKSTSGLRKKADTASAASSYFSDMSSSRLEYTFTVSCNGRWKPARWPSYLCSAKRDNGGPCFGRRFSKAAMAFATAVSTDATCAASIGCGGMPGCSGTSNDDNSRLSSPAILKSARKTKPTSGLFAKASRARSRARLSPPTMVSAAAGTTDASSETPQGAM
mmetsp:Transcript_14380/g.43554  ORF Transcript_14380/g.43554 Transcript_14380/m.43554 type:complete len:256 (+) Transcript_14380:229-996(+)